MSRNRLLTAVLPTLLVLAACAAPASTSAAGTGTTVSSITMSAAAAVAPDPAESTAAAAVDPAVDQDAVLAEVAAAATAAGGSIAVVVLDADGDPVLASADADDAVDTASLVKLLVVQQLLVDDEAGVLELSDADLALMQAAIEDSDDDAMNQLWVDFDGAALVTAAAEQFGLTATAPPAEVGQWGQSTTSAADYAVVLAGYDDTLDDADAALLTGWLQSTSATAADGFDQIFGLLSLGLTGTAAKQGWMSGVADTRQLHSAGVLPDGRTVVLLGSFPDSTGWAAAAAALDAAAAAVVAGT